MKYAISLILILLAGCGSNSVQKNEPSTTQAPQKLFTNNQIAKCQQYAAHVTTYYDMIKNSGLSSSDMSQMFPEQLKSQDISLNTLEELDSANKNSGHSINIMGYYQVSCLNKNLSLTTPPYSYVQPKLQKCNNISSPKSHLDCAIKNTIITTKEYKNKTP
jgi:hypothetical protein